MKLRMSTILLIASALSSSAFAQDADPELQAFVERERARSEAREQEQMKNFSPERRERFKRLIAANKLSSRKINGKETPELVPHHIRMQLFFQSYEDGSYRRALENQLSAPDIAALDAITLRYRGEIKKFGEAYQKDWMQVHSQAQFKNAAEIARDVKAASDRIEAAQSAFYQEAIRQLTPEGQKIVNEFAFVNVRPTITLWDPAPTAAAEPELYKEHVVSLYNHIRLGMLPTPPVDEVATKTEGQGASLSGP